MEKKTILAIVFATIIIDIASLSIPVYTLQVYDRILVQHNNYTLLVLSIFATFVILLELLVRIMRKQYVLKVVHANGLVEVHETLSKFMNADTASVENITSDDIKDYFSSVRNKFDYYIKKITVSVDMIFLICLLLTVTFLAPKLGMVTMVIISTFIITMLLLENKIKKIKHGHADASKKKFALLEKILENIAFMKGNALVGLSKRQHNFYETQEISEYIKVTDCYLFIKNMSTCLMQVNLIIMACIGAFMVINNEVTMGTLIACIIISGRFAAPINQCVDLWYHRNEQSKFIEREKLIQKITKIESHPVSKDREPNLSFSDVIYMKSSSKKIIDNLNLSLQKGESISIHGMNLEENLILVRLITGAYRPTSGYIYLSDFDPYYVSPSDRNKLIGYLSYNLGLVTGSILDSISNYNLVSEQAVFDICHSLGIHKTIMQLPNGYHTIVGENISKEIPPSLIQLICVARILATEPKIILYNQAETYMDPKAYNTIINYLTSKKEQTILIILSNDKNICSIADTQYNFAHGKIILRKDNTDDNVDFLQNAAKIYG